MSKNGLNFMDSDMHVIEPVDLWQRYIDPEYMERAHPWAWLVTSRTCV